MTRPLRLEFAGALYHLTARGDRQEPIFEDDQDRLVFKQTVYLLRRRANLSLREVAEMAGVTIGRVAQIQSVLLTPGVLCRRLATAGSGKASGLLTPVLADYY